MFGGSVQARLPPGQARRRHVCNYFSGETISAYPRGIRDKPDGGEIAVALSRRIRNPR